MSPLSLPLPITLSPSIFILLENVASRRGSSFYELLPKHQKQADVSPQYFLIFFPLSPFPSPHLSQWLKSKHTVYKNSNFQT